MTKTTAFTPEPMNAASWITAQTYPVNGGCSVAQ